MTKISEYPIISNPTEDDILIGTDVNSSDVTKNFSIGSIIDLIGDINEGPIGPQGNTGPTGPQGPVGPAGLEWQGEWVSGTSYVEDDAVGYDGASWFCILATSGTTAPDVDTTHWALLASQGAIGPTGPAGPTGPQGPEGTAVLLYKAYRASLNFQSGIINVTVHENNLGGSLTWAYSGGFITCTSSTLFTTSKTFATSTTYYGSGVVVSFNPFIQSTSVINYLSVRTDDNTQFIPFSSAIVNVEILVYN